MASEAAATDVDAGGGSSSQRASTTDIVVNNVVCSFSTRCHLNLRKIATQGIHVEYKKENSIVNMRLRKPYTTATVWSSGKITCVGAKSEADAYKAARRYCRLLQKMQFKVKLCNYRVVNVLATSTVPFTLDVARLANEYQKECSYEPELHPGATFKLKELKTTLKLFATGSITLTAPSVQTARQAVEQMYPILEKFKHASSLPRAEEIKPVVNNSQTTVSNNHHHHLQFTPSHHITPLNHTKTNNGDMGHFSNPAVVMTTATMPVVTAVAPTPNTDTSYFNSYHHNLSHSHLYHHTNDLLTSPSSFEHDFYASASNGVVTGTHHHHHHHHHHHLQTNFYHQHSATSHQLFAGSTSSLPASTASSSSSSQPNNWFYDNLIIEPVDDFLP